MKIRFLSVWLISAAATVAGQAAEELPPPEATEYWTPVPAVVSVPAGGVPSDALVLFDGTSLAAWRPERADSAGWKVEDGAMTVVPKTGTMVTRAEFGDVQLHIEWRAPAVVKGKSQGRGNSGIFFMGQYEVQVLDSYDNPTYVNGQAGSLYKQHPPLVNAARPPGEWQTYDIVFVAPRFAADGTLVSPARATIFHNGVLVQHDAALRGATVWRGQPAYKAHAPKLPITLQDHGDLVSYRNIWVRELALPEAAK